LRASDQIRIEAEVSRPAYLYVLWIDSQGKALPVYPWKPGCWEEYPAKEEPTDRLSLPEQRNRGWPMGGGPGMETVVLLGRDGPLPPELDLTQLLADFGPQTMQHLYALVEFDAGQVLGSAVQPDRGPQFFDPQQIDDPVLKTQQRLAETLGPHFQLIRAVSFANQGAR
jgi:hypothetical protein